LKPAVLLVAALSVATPLCAWAQAPSARQHFIDGTKHFDLGEYREALAEFKEAFRIKEDPVFLYNIAQCHRLLGENAEAIRFLKNYLRRAPDAPNRADVESRIAALQELVDRQEKERAQKAQAAAAAPPQPSPQPSPIAAAATPSPETAAPAPSPTPVYKKWWLWTLVGVAVVAAAGVGVAVGVASQSQSSGPASPFGTGVTF
jgi:tetratricopeptide (TPR) repeat protein